MQIKLKPVLLSSSSLPQQTANEKESKGNLNITRADAPVLPALASLTVSLFVVQPADEQRMDSNEEAEAEWEGENLRKNSGSVCGAAVLCAC